MEGEEGGPSGQGVALVGDQPQVRGGRHELSLHSQADSSPMARRRGGSHFFGLLKIRKPFWIGWALTFPFCTAPLFFTKNNLSPLISFHTGLYVYY